MNKEDYIKYYIQGSDHYLIPKDIFDELFNEMSNWREEVKELNQKYLNAVADYEQEKFNVEELKKQLKEYKRLGFKHLQNRNNELENQQKEFIEYLENEIKERTIQIVGYHPTTQLLIEQIIETEKMVLSKYREIIGGKDE